MSIKRRELIRGAAGSLALPALPLAAGTETERFTFCVLGDTCYDIPGDRPVYMALIDKINAAAPDFSIHVGDTKGAESCGEKTQRRIYEDFMRFDHPLIYTPGDNEWADWYLEVNGRGDPLLALQLIRAIFFTRPESLGQRVLPLTRQADISAHDNMVENATWWHRGVCFATVHLPGSNNGYPHDADPGRIATEFLPRNRANIEWVEYCFAEAKDKGARAMVLAFHADWFDGPEYEFDGFADLREVIRRQCLGTEIPVLLLHGDSHRFVIDRPFHRKRHSGYNTLRMQTYGSPELRAVLITVDPGGSLPFAFETLSVPQRDTLYARAGT